MECTAHQRSKYQIPTEHDRAEFVHLDPLREIESHEGFAAAPARLCASSALYPDRSGGGDRGFVAKWLNTQAITTRTLQRRAEPTIEEKARISCHKFAISPSSPTWTTARPRWWTPCCTRAASSAITRSS